MQPSAAMRGTDPDLLGCAELRFWARGDFGHRVIG
jgi:hypothetical protein